MVRADNQAWLSSENESRVKVFLSSEEFYAQSILEQALENNSRKLFYGVSESALQPTK